MVRHLVQLWKLDKVTVTMWFRKGSVRHYFWHFDDTSVCRDRDMLCSATVLFCRNTWLPVASIRWNALYFCKCKGKERNTILQEYNLYQRSDCCKLTLFFSFVLKHLMSISWGFGKKIKKHLLFGNVTLHVFLIGHIVQYWHVLMYISYVSTKQLQQ